MRIKLIKNDGEGGGDGTLRTEKIDLCIPEIRIKINFMHIPFCFSRGEIDICITI